jgi:hypothetical protein
LCNHSVTKKKGRKKNAKFKFVSRLG